MRHLLAYLLGFACTVAARHFLGVAADHLGLVASLPLPYPVERSYGRGASEEVTDEYTLLGFSLLATSVGIGIAVGIAIYRARIKCWTNSSERATFLSWSVFLPFLLAYSATFQAVFGSDVRWPLDLIEFTPPALVGWYIYRRWKAAQLPEHRSWG